MYLILSVNGCPIKAAQVLKVEIIGIKRGHKHASRWYGDLKWVDVTQCDAIVITMLHTNKKLQNIPLWDLNSSQELG